MDTVKAIFMLINQQVLSTFALQNLYHVTKLLARAHAGLHALFTLWLTVSCWLT